MVVHLGAKVVSEREVGQNSAACAAAPHVMYSGIQLPLLVGKAPFFECVFSGRGAFSVTSLQRRIDSSSGLG